MNQKSTIKKIRRPFLHSPATTPKATAGGPGAGATPPTQTPRAPATIHVNASASSGVPRAPARIKVANPIALSGIALSPGALKLFGLLGVPNKLVPRLLKGRPRLKEILQHEDFFVGVHEREAAVGKTNERDFVLRMHPGDAILLLEAFTELSPSWACRFLSGLSLDVLTNMMSNPKSSIDATGAKEAWGWVDVRCFFDSLNLSKPRPELAEAMQILQATYRAAIRWTLDGVATPAGLVLFKTWLDACPEWTLHGVLQDLESDPPAIASTSKPHYPAYQKVLDEARVRSSDVQKVFLCLHSTMDDAKVLLQTNPNMFRAIANLGVDNLRAAPLGEVQGSGMVMHLLRNLVVPTPDLARRLLLWLPNELIFDTMTNAPTELRQLLEGLDPTPSFDFAREVDVSLLVKRWGSWIEERSCDGCLNLLDACPGWIMDRLLSTNSFDQRSLPSKPGTSLASLLESDPLLKSAWTAACKRADEHRACQGRGIVKAFFDGLGVSEPEALRLIDAHPSLSDAVVAMRVDHRVGTLGLAFDPSCLSAVFKELMGADPALALRYLRSDDARSALLNFCRADTKAILANLDIGSTSQALRSEVDSLMRSIVERVMALEISMRQNPAPILSAWMDVLPPAMRLELKVAVEKALGSQRIGELCQSNKELAQVWRAAELQNHSM